MSLFPFVIDYNALIFEEGSKICFFSAKDLTENILEYRFLGDNSLVKIEHKGIVKKDIDYNEFLLSNDNRKSLNLDNIVDSFNQARKTILGDSSIDFDNL